MNLILLRDFARDQTTWGDFPDRLRAHAPHLNLHFLDNPGVGTEYRRGSPASISAIRIDLAQRFHAAISRGKLPAAPWSILGISLGSMVALDWSLAEPDLFKNVILLNSSSADIASPIERFRIRYFPGALYSFLTNRAEDFERFFFGAASNRFARIRGERDAQIQSLYEAAVKSRRDRPVSRATYLHQLMAAARFRIPEGRPRGRTVFIAGTGDRIASPNCSGRMSERLGADLLSHPWAGHDLPADDPEWLAREVSEWLGSRP